MPKLMIEGGQKLSGAVTASGAKNAALPILAATILLENKTDLFNVPFVNDIHVMIRMLNALGVRAEYHAPNRVQIWNNKKIRHIAPYELVTALRASFFVAGPLLAKTKYAKVPLPGGCSIGSRPIDLHLKGFRALGASVQIEHGFVDLKAQKLIGAHIYLDFASVGATENIMMAACLAEGKTVIENAAREPEIIDLAHFLNKAGAKITGAGDSIIEIQGVSQLSGTEHSIIPDRVEVGTLLIAGAITQGNVTVNQACCSHLDSLIQKLRECGLTIQHDAHSVQVISHGPVTGINVETLPFPGFPTDMQAQMMALLCVAQGTSLVKETIFENRFMHAPELNRMGAKITIENHCAIVHGVPQLSGAEVKITDLRAGAALIVAALAAKGTTTLYGLKHLKRGYEHLPEKLASLGACIIE